jgi:hypothetical protein
MGSFRGLAVYQYFFVGDELLQAGATPTLNLGRQEGVETNAFVIAGDHKSASQRVVGGWHWSIAAGRVQP